MTLTWQFPLPRPHTGVPLGNGSMGLLLWGDTDAQPNRLMITVGRAGFWDRRGGNPFASRTTFSQVKRLLQSADHAGLHQAFGLINGGLKKRPHQIGCGRLELEFPLNWRITAASLETEDSAVVVRLVNDQDESRTVRVQLGIGHDTAWIDLPSEMAVNVRGRASWEWAGDQLQADGVCAPMVEDSVHSGGWCQKLPEDESLALRWRRQAQRVVIVTALGSHAWKDAGKILAQEDLRAIESASSAWWMAAKADVPHVCLPDARLQQAWELGVHRWLGATTPSGVACTLQGPWLEEYQIPPWSCDYHFNINVQMIYQPGLMLGRPDHFTPLWNMIREWLPGLRAAGEAFFGVPGAVLLPHAVDDRCQVVGTFWTGMIDHACTGWMALLAFSDWRYHGKREVLETVAWPLLVGAHLGYQAMSEVYEGRLSLAVSVSPEFKGARADAWGRDASFQLACWHAVLRDLPLAAAALGHPIDPTWDATAARLPHYTSIQGSRTREYPEIQAQRIALWQGMDLLESHRHHSHLGGLWPFCTLDPLDLTHSAVLRESLYHWVRTGPGAWSGWCVPWAATLCARMGWADAAIAWLQWQQQVFTNVGHGTLHDGDFPGCTTLAGDTHQAPHEIYQLDAGCGVLTAIAELLVQERQGVLHVLPAIPKAWRDLSFSRLRVAGGFELSAVVRAGIVSKVTARSMRGGSLRVAHGLGHHWASASAVKNVSSTPDIFACKCVPGEELHFERQP